MNLDRRQALKSIVLGSGAVIASTSILSLLNTASASSTREHSWSFLTNEQAEQLTAMCAIILPHSDEIPGAAAVSIIPFLDLVYSRLVSEDEKEKFTKGMSAFGVYCRKEHGSSFIKLSVIQQTKCLQKLYNLPDEKREQMLWKIDNNNADATKDEQYFLYSFLFNLRSVTLEAYMNSQLIGEKVMAYDQVPGNYEDYELTPTSRAWSP